MLGHYRSFRRLTTILLILAHYDVEPLSTLSFPFRLLTWIMGLHPAVRRVRRLSAQVRLRKAMEEMGPTFIKFGQALSTRTEILPDDFSVEMKKLQDDVPPFPFAQVEEIIQKDLGGPVEQFFRTFAINPVASASMAQVHRATTLAGREVAVKVMRPNVIALVELDIRMLTTLAELVDTYLPEWRRMRAKQVVAEFAASIRNEINFQIEASRAQKFRENFREDREMRVPAVIWALSTRRVLTMEWIEGVPIDELVHRSADGKIDPVTISRNIVTSFFKQVFRDGYFHADQHPGNIFVLADGTLAILDFGIVGRVSRQDRMVLAKILQGFLQRDYRLVAEMHVVAGYVPHDTNVDAFEEACQMLAEPIFGQPLKDISIGNLLAELFKVTEQFNMAVQPHLLLLQKTMLVLEGVGREINPDLNMWELSGPLIRDWMTENLGPKGRLLEAGAQAKKLYSAATLVPDIIVNGLERLSQDQFQLRIHPSSLEELERAVSRGLRSQTWAIVGGTLFLGSGLLLLGGQSAWWYMPPLTGAVLSYLFSIKPGER
ncbi:2-polyprenylphenol 6-hydroxylase [Candidatus Magnetaquicoccus inordinatus]|uniref:2-polyprenylphenol 6-hydroxylase n=1 Tax=Candidatus Magnetaquicoccus inordinatus TaxID=2496818 RepID=UPI00102C7048|nr:2-polyprenylphenol 6-hydroxylase [Candidatus Magnetaquicoccus inordinatus]